MSSAQPQNKVASYENRYYGSVLPNLLLSPDIPSSASKDPNIYSDTVNVYDPYTKKNASSKSSWASYLKSVNVDKNLVEKHRFCRGATSPGVLAGTVNYSDKIRCGWIIKKGPDGSPNPLISEGALGDKNAPLSFLEHGKGTWFWNLMDAQEELDKTRCGALKNCRDIGSTDFYGKCAFCTTSGRGVPIKPDGSIKYPTNSLLSCSKTVREVGSCPPPPAPGSPAAIAAASDVCSMNNSGQVSRNCLINRLMAAGCKDNGSLSVALQTGATPDNYAASLETLPSFAKYQMFSTTPLNTDILRQGQGSSQVALAEFQRLVKDALTIDETTAIGAASRDLCLKSGAFDNYDFCSELSDSSRSPFSIECLQKEFRRRGGQPAGILYPMNNNVANPLEQEISQNNESYKYLVNLGLKEDSQNETFDKISAKKRELDSYKAATNTFTYWNTNYNTWGDVKTAMEALVKKSKSISPSEQSLALKQLYGITRETAPLNQISPINGFEIFFFPYPGYGKDDKLTFLGRRILTGVDFPTLPDDNLAGKFNTGFNQIHFAILTNLRPTTNETNIAFQVTTGDGTALAINTDIDPIRIQSSTSDYFSRFWNQAPSTSTNDTCSQMIANGPNYTTIRYYNGGRISGFKLQYKNCSSGEIKKIPSQFFTLTQEQSAPLASFEVMERDNVSFFEELRLGRGMFSGQVLGNGTAEILHQQMLVGGWVPYKLSKNMSWKIKSRIAFQSLRTITFVWKPETLPMASGSSATIFSWVDTVSQNGLTIKAIRNAGSVNLSATWSIPSTGLAITSTMANAIDDKSTYYTRITFEVKNTQLPTNIIISTIPVGLNDTSRIESSDNQISLISPTGVLYSRYIVSQDMAGFMTFGASQQQANDITLQIGFLHLFDYVLNTSQVQIDIGRNWKRKFIYEVDA